MSAAIYWGPHRACPRGTVVQTPICTLATVRGSWLHKQYRPVPERVSWSLVVTGDPSHQTELYIGGPRMSQQLSVLVRGARQHQDML